MEAIVNCFSKAVDLEGKQEVAIWADDPFKVFIDQMSVLSKSTPDIFPVVRLWIALLH